MPPVTRWFLKSSLLFFVAALVVAILLSLRPLVELPALLRAAGPTYLHIFMVGWVTQMIFGVAVWLFPRKTRKQPRGWEWLNWAAFAGINAGLVLRIIAEPALASGSESTAWGVVLAASAGLQWLGGMAFVINNWPRVKGK